MICPKRTCNKLHALSPIKNDTRYWIMVSVVSKKLSHIITIRSPLMVTIQFRIIKFVLILMTDL